MKQSQFEQTYEAGWQRYDQQVESLKKGRGHGVATYTDFPEQYTQLCQQYALAQQRQYSPRLIEALQQRVQRGHDILYRQRSGWLWSLITFYAVDFPRAVRHLWPQMLLACGLFFGVGILVGVVCYLDGSFLFKIMPAEQVVMMEAMYAISSESVGRDEMYSDSSRFLMFGYYIYNNIGIGLRTFALGILASIGTIFALVYNGLVLGGVSGHLTQLGLHETFWGFVSGHSAFELTAIAICGAAGLRLGQPLIAPGRYRLGQAFVLAGKESIPLVIGAATLLLLAAAIEAFWSPLSLSLSVKVTVGLTLWLFLLVYLLFAGRQRPAKSHVG